MVNQITISVRPTNPVLVGDIAMLRPSFLLVKHAAQMLNP
jgi:hypothetical protein